MITIHPQRKMPGDRIPSESEKPVTQMVQSFSAPIAGWVTNENMATQRPDSAFVLDNFWPTTVAIEARGGYEARVDVAGTVASLHEYSAGGEYIVSDGTALYKFDANTAVGTTLSSVVSGLSSGDFQGVETQNDAGSFLTLVNGVDNLQLYDGTTWYTVTDVSATHSITGVDTDTLTYVWNYRSRTWFVEADSMNAWYLGINSVSGAATKFPLAGVFKKGGNLHSGATFSSDSGDGMDDRIIFLTDQGEIAIYTGDPTSPSLVGVYDVGTPVSDDPYITIGGDVLIATVSGLIPVSGAVQKGPEQLKLVSVSRPIEREWEYWVYLQPTGWKVTKWATKGMAIFAVPSTEQPFAFVVNLETGAWTRFTEWQANAVTTFGDKLYLANGSDVHLGDSTGSDNGTAITYKMCSAFSGLADLSAHKTAKRVRGAFRRSVDFEPQFSIATDYTYKFPAVPNSAASVALDDAAIWDAAPWDTTSWASYGRRKGAVTKWHVVSGQGLALAVQLQITSAEDAKPDFELVSYDLTYTMGRT